MIPPWRLALLLAFGGTLGAAEPVLVPLRVTPSDPDRLWQGRSGEAGADGVWRFAFPYADGWLRCRPHGDGVLLDRTGDGRLDEGDGTAVAWHAPVTVRLADGAQYHLCFMRDHRGRIILLSACTAEGVFAGDRFEILDVDVDGRFDRVGVDRVVRDGMDAADRDVLMPVMRFAGALHTVVSDGPTLRLTPWDGPVCQLHVAATGAPEVLGLPGVRGARLTLRRTDGRMQVVATAAAPTPVLPGEWLILDETLYLEGATAEEEPYLHRGASWTPLTLTAGDHHLERRPPERMRIDGCVVDGVLELATPQLLCADGRWYSPRLWGAADETQRLDVRFVRDGRESPAAKLDYG